MAKTESLPSKYLLVLDPKTLVKANSENHMDFLISKDNLRWNKWKYEWMDKGAQEGTQALYQQTRESL